MYIVRRLFSNKKGPNHDVALRATSPPSRDLDILPKLSGIKLAFFWILFFSGPFWIQWRLTGFPDKTSFHTACPSLGDLACTRGFVILWISEDLTYFPDLTSLTLFTSWLSRDSFCLVFRLSTFPSEEVRPGKGSSPCDNSGLTLLSLRATGLEVWTSYLRCHVGTRESRPSARGPTEPGARGSRAQSPREGRLHPCD